MAERHFDWPALVARANVPQATSVNTLPGRALAVALGFLAGLFFFDWLLR